jgi:hypothetical protein
MNTKQQIITTYSQLAMIYGKQLTPEALVLMADSLDDLHPQAVLKILKDWVKGNKAFPMPSEIREKITPQTNDADDGRDIASRAIKAVAKFGWNQPLQAKLYIGEIGWECVSRMGGWTTFCAELNEENKGIYNAQIRDLAITLKKKDANGTLDLPLNFSNSLPAPNKEIAEKVKNLLPTFPFKEIE